jgi:3-dehydroquinate synthase
MTVPIDTLEVELGSRRYPIRVGPGLLGIAGRELEALFKRRRAVVVTDHTVAKLHLPTLATGLTAVGIATEAIQLPAGEATKDFAHLETLLDELLACKVERSDLVLALGGGVIGDLTGFACAVLRRGTAFAQLPTTLLAQVDSSVGGKTAINSRHGKNLIGAFHQPRAVLADVGVLDTLPKRELLAGYAEVAKYGLIGDAAFFTWLERHGQALIEGDMAARRYAVTVSCTAKAAIVARDEREDGERALLNFGHTFGHALEAEHGYSAALLHGEAVAIGMVLAFELSAALGLCPAADAVRVRRHLALIGQMRATAADLYRHMGQDKKVRDGRLTFVLTRGIGTAFLSRDVAAADVMAVLERELMA